MIPALTAYQLAKKAGKSALELGTGKVGTRLTDAINTAQQRSNKRIRTGFEGELHAVMPDGEGNVVKYNYMGPGTHLQERLARGDEGVDKWGLDAAAKQHDTDYVTGDKSLAATIAADRRYIAAVEATSAPAALKEIAKRPIMMKTGAEQALGRVIYGGGSGAKTELAGFGVENAAPGGPIFSNPQG